MKHAKTMSASGQAKGTPISTASSNATDADELLKQDHRKVEQLFEQYEAAGNSGRKTEIAKKICLELIIHTQIEEELFYPACREKDVEDEMLDKAQVEHDGAKILVTELMGGSSGDEFYDAKAAVLSEYIKHHVGEEEKPGEGILAKARNAGVDMHELGTRIQARKAELMSQSDTLGSRPPRLRSLHPARMQSTKEDSSMPRYSNDRDRNEQGRFMNDDDRRSSRSHSSRSRFDDDDDRRSSREGRGWYGDSEGHSGASERGWQDRGRGNYARSRGYNEDDGRSYGRGGNEARDRGWYGDSEGHSDASERGWEHRAGNGGRGRGWYGDAEGHSEASERGWEHRGHSRASHNRDYDDDRRHSRGGHGGWYGDRQGHSEASERGWEHRGHGSSSRSRDYDDDRRSSRGGGGHGGWYGDPSGHAEASRRGWEDR